MEDLKIKVGDEDSAIEARNLFRNLGFTPDNSKYGQYVNWVAVFEDGSGSFFSTDVNLEECKEITLPELRDMVVLKRNNVGDSNAYCSDNNEHYFITSSGDYYFFFKEKSEWYKSSNDIMFLKENVKPIKEDVMKEYLDPDNGYDFIKWTGFAHPPESFIEVPEGAEAYLINPKVKEFLRNINGGMQRFYNDDWINCVDSHINYIDHDFNQIVWIRGEKESTMQEQLDYADELRAMGESGWSKEKHSHYKKDVSHLKMIDPYRIADLYNLHPCADHIMKKSLCAGNRGHKDMLRDIQDIIDTAERWKQMIEEDNNEI
ncbi:MAG: hypothetical protein ABS863_00385 [Aerococcus urinaeequi]